MLFLFASVTSLYHRKHIWDARKGISCFRRRSSIIEAKSQLWAKFILISRLFLDGSAHGWYGMVDFCNYDFWIRVTPTTLSIKRSHGQLNESASNKTELKRHPVLLNASVVSWLQSSVSFFGWRFGGLEIVRNPNQLWSCRIRKTQWHLPNDAIDCFRPMKRLLCRLARFRTDRVEGIRRLTHTDKWMDPLSRGAYNQGLDVMHLISADLHRPLL